MSDYSFANAVMSSGTMMLPSSSTAFVAWVPSHWRWGNSGHGKSCCHTSWTRPLKKMS